MAKRVRATHEILPNLAVSLCVRDVEMYAVPAVRPLMGSRNLTADAGQTFAPPYPIYVHLSKRTNLVCITDVKPIKELLQLSHCSNIQVNEIQRFTRLGSSKQDLIRQYSSNIAPHLMTRSAAQAYGLMCKNTLFRDHLADLLNVRPADVLQFRHIRRIFPKVSRSTWQSQLEADQKRPYRRGAADTGSTDPPDSDSDPDGDSDGAKAAPIRARPHSDSDQVKSENR